MFSTPLNERPINADQKPNARGHPCFYWKDRRIPAGTTHHAQATRAPTTAKRISRELKSNNRRKHPTSQRKARKSTNLPLVIFTLSVQESRELDEIHFSRAQPAPTETEQTRISDVRR